MKKDKLLRRCIVSHLFFLAASCVFSILFLPDYAINYVVYSFVGVGVVYAIIVFAESPIPLGFDKLIQYPMHAVWFAELFPPIATFVSLIALVDGSRRVPMEYALAISLGGRLAEFVKISSS